VLSDFVFFEGRLIP